MSNVAAFELAEAPREIEIDPVAIHIGAEIGGVDLTKPLSGRAVKEIRRGPAEMEGDFLPRSASRP